MRQDTSGDSLAGAFAALEQFTRGDDPAALLPIEQAVREAHGNAAARAALEQRLVRHLAAPASDAARTFVCRELAVIGSSASVPALAALLGDDHLSHMARYALERIPGPEADRALRDALARTRGNTRVGIIHSLGARRDARSVPLLARLLADDAASAAAAARALGEIGTPEAARALQASRGRSGGDVGTAVADAMLMSAERLLASGDRAHAVKLLEALTDSSQPPHVRLAARRALSAAMRP
jgi:HEAT repeat protein